MKQPLLSQAASAMGKRSAKVVMKKYGKEHYKWMADLATIARKQKAATKRQVELGTSQEGSVV